MKIILVFRPEACDMPPEQAHKDAPFNGVEILALSVDDKHAEQIVECASQESPGWHFMIDEVPDEIARAAVIAIEAMKRGAGQSEG